MDKTTEDASVPILVFTGRFRGIFVPKESKCPNKHMKYEPMFPYFVVFFASKTKFELVVLRSVPFTQSQSLINLMYQL